VPYGPNFRSTEEYRLEKSHSILYPVFLSVKYMLSVHIYGTIKYSQKVLQPNDAKTSSVVANIVQCLRCVD